jgi:CRISPR-associated protein Csd2
MNNEILSNRHDIYLLFEVTNGNPNGDPDAGNMPRMEGNTGKGIVSEFSPAENGKGYEIFVQSGDALERKIREATAANNKDAKTAVEWLCNKFYDIRAFGGVLSVGDEVMKGSAYGQVRGPVQFTFSQSFHEITPMDISITRCVATTINDENKQRTMGSKFIVPYGLYAAKIYVSPAFAERTGFTNHDLEILFEALGNMFEHDRSAARGEMIVRGIYDFEHVGTQHENNAEANKREARLGCAHAHKLFEGISVDLKDGKEFPESFADYQVACDWTDENLPKGVKLHKRAE